MTADKKDKEKAEREKGTAPPDYMPSIFGWMTMDDQVEHAREIIDFIDKIEETENNDNRK